VTPDAVAEPEEPTATTPTARRVQLIVEPPAEHPWRSRPKPPTVHAGPTRAVRSDVHRHDPPSPHWIRRALIAAAVTGALSYTLVAFFGHGAHTAPRPTLASGTSQARTTVPARQARMGVAVELAGADVTVTSVTPTSPAGRAGIHPGDIIADADGIPVVTPNQLAAIVQTHHIGDSLHLVLMRNGQRSTISVTLTAP